MKRERKREKSTKEKYLKIKGNVISKISRKRNRDKEKK